MYKDQPVSRHAPLQLPNQSVAQLRTTAPHAQAQPVCGIWQIPLSKLKRSFSSTYLQIAWANLAAEEAGLGAEGLAIGQEVLFATSTNDAAKTVAQTFFFFNITSFAACRTTVVAVFVVT